MIYLAATARGRLPYLGSVATVVHSFVCSHHVCATRRADVSSLTMRCALGGEVRGDDVASMLLPTR